MIAKLKIYADETKNHLVDLAKNPHKGFFFSGANMFLCSLGYFLFGGVPTLGMFFIYGYLFSAISTAAFLGMMVVQIALGTFFPAKTSLWR